MFDLFSVLSSISPHQHRSLAVTRHRSGDGTAPHPGTTYTHLCLPGATERWDTQFLHNHLEKFFFLNYYYYYYLTRSIINLHKMQQWQCRTEWLSLFRSHSLVSSPGLLIQRDSEALLKHEHEHELEVQDDMPASPDLTRLGWRRMWRTGLSLTWNLSMGRFPNANGKKCHGFI